MRNLFFLIFITVFLGLNFYVFYKIYRFLPATLLSALAVTTLAVLMLVALFGSVVWGEALFGSLTSIAYRLGTAWIFVFLYLLLFFLVTDLLQVLHLIRLERFMIHNWIGAGALTLVLAAVFIFGNIVYHHKKRTEIDVKTEKQTGENGRMKILLISDLHLGYTIKRAEVDKWVTMLNAEHADLILIAGDVIDRFVRPLEEEQMHLSLNKLQARYGVFLALGNHDLMGNTKENMAFLQKTNFTILRDTALLVEDAFYVIGRNDFSQAGRASLADILKNAAKDKPLLLLDHQPNALAEAAENGIDLQVSGHTHNGQVFPVNLIEKMIFEQPYGYLKKGNTRFYITSGLGIWGGKFRIGSRSEYVVINLEGKKTECK